MPDIEITDRQLKALERFMKLLPHGKELDLVILQAHLLIEEQVNALIDEQLKNTPALKRASWDRSTAFAWPNHSSHPTRSPGCGPR